MQNESVQFGKSAKRGFTLIELLVVISIMTILTGIGASIFTGTSQTLQVKKAATSMLLMAQYARMSAIEQQRAYKLYIDNANNEFYLVTTLYDYETQVAEEIVIEESLCAPVVLENQIIIEDVQVLSNDYNLGSTSSNLYLIAFAPDGTSQTAVVQIGDEETHYTLSVNEVTGKSKLYAGTIDDVPIDTIDIDLEYY